MKKKLLVVVLVMVVFASGVLVEKFLFSNDIDDSVNDISQIKHEHMLSMMLEQNAGAGDYSLETRSSWPTQEEGYVFNSTLSKCEKGSKLRWDEENNAVVMIGTTSDKCYVYFDKYNAIKINSSSATVSGNSVIITIDATAGDGAIYKYYYSKDNGLSYVDSTSNTYTFVGLTTGDYTIKYYVEDTNGKPSEVITKQVSVTSVTLAAWVKSQYTGTQGENNLYYHDSTLTNGAGDNSYRYAGASDTTNNFVCFGSDATTCPDDNLYRIIGVFGDQVKLIKWDYATSSLLGTDTSDYDDSYSYDTSYYQGDSSNLRNIGEYYWNKQRYDAAHSATGYYNDWSYSKLNKTHLNTNFLTNIGSKWANMIDSTVWKVGGNTYANMYNSNAQTAFTNEITSPSTQVTNTYESKVGLMYVSDYYYGASPTYWTYPGYSSSGASYDYRAATRSNWMYMGLFEWIMTRSSSYSANASRVFESGYVDYYMVNRGNYAVRPVFYLNFDVTYKSGSGTKSNPITINLD